MKPAIVSKKASVTLLNVSLNRYGNMPNTEKNTQMIAVSMRPSRLCIDVLRGLMPKAINAPAAAVMRVLYIKAIKAVGSSNHHDMARGSSMKAASISNSQPCMRSTMAKLILWFLRRDILGVRL